MLRGTEIIPKRRPEKEVVGGGRPGHTIFLEGGGGVTHGRFVMHEIIKKKVWAVRM